MPDNNDNAIEQMIQDKGLTAPRITPAHIDALMDTLIIDTHHFEGTTSTVAIATLPGGFVVATGFSACVSAANFDAAVGVAVAAGNAKAAAREKLWELEGYALYKQQQEAGQ